MKQISASCFSPRGITLTESIVACACAAFIVTLLSGAAMMMRRETGEQVSKANMAALYISHVEYAASNSGKQWCSHLDNFGLVGGNCSSYVSQIQCPPQQILGSTADGSLWAYWVSSPLCPPPSPGDCVNWPTLLPNSFGSSDWFGSAQMINVRSFHNYLGGRFYDSRFYAPNDTTVYNAAAVNFNNPAEFVSMSSAVWSSYMMSAAAMWSPEVLRPATSGGYQAPTFATAFTRQNLAGAAYPELKTLMFEKNWNQGAPTPNRRYNESLTSRPVTLFYDGHVANIFNMVAFIDDKRSTIQSGNGLWCRNTPFIAGLSGYYGRRTSHSVLTTSGILGRDVLDTRCGIGGVDLTALLADWGGTTMDLSQDGVVSGPDITTLLSNWGCPE